LHRVDPVRSGVRVAAFFWIQSMVRNESDRAILFDLDTAIQSLSGDGGDADDLVRLTGVYHNLLRRWAEV
jgi:PKHD-type hydroxylase